MDEASAAYYEWKFEGSMPDNIKELSSTIIKNLTPPATMDKQYHYNYAILLKYLAEEYGDGNFGKGDAFIRKMYEDQSDDWMGKLEKYTVSRASFNVEYYERLLSNYYNTFKRPMDIYTVGGSALVLKKYDQKDIDAAAKDKKTLKLGEEQVSVNPYSAELVKLVPLQYKDPSGTGYLIPENLVPTVSLSGVPDSDVEFRVFKVSETASQMLPAPVDGKVMLTGFAEASNTRCKYVVLLINKTDKNIQPWVNVDFVPEGVTIVPDQKEYEVKEGETAPHKMSAVVNPDDTYDFEWDFKDGSETKKISGVKSSGSGVEHNYGVGDWEPTVTVYKKGTNQVIGSAVASIKVTLKKDNSSTTTPTTTPSADDGLEKLQGYWGNPASEQIHIDGDSAVFTVYPENKYGGVASTLLTHPSYSFVGEPYHVGETYLTDIKKIDNSTYSCKINLYVWNIYSKKPNIQSTDYTVVHTSWRETLNGIIKLSSDYIRIDFEEELPRSYDGFTEDCSDLHTNFRGFVINKTLYNSKTYK
jgi:hypothetical protein